MTNTNNKNLIFDSNDYLEENDDFYIMEDLDYLLSENIVEPRGQIEGWMFLSKRSSHYGSICNNGATGFARKDKKVLAEAILSVDTDRIVVEKDNGELKVTFSDHDGSHITKIKPITKSRLIPLERIEDNFDKMLAYVETMPTVKTK